MTDRMRLAADSIANTIHELQRITSYLDPNEFDNVVDLVAHCATKTVITGVGTSAAAARKIAHSLACTGIPAMFLSACDSLHGGSGVLAAGDVVILVSKGGKSREINELVPIARARGATTVAVTESRTNPLANVADHVLRLFVERESDTSGVLATASTAVAIALFDAVCHVLMAERGFSKREFLTIHPGGDVGDRLARD